MKVKLLKQIQKPVFSVMRPSLKETPIFADDITIKEI